jgi:hypothetical protein
MRHLGMLVAAFAVVTFTGVQIEPGAARPSDGAWASLSAEGGR